MACAALKRPYNFDLLASNPDQQLTSNNKRRRCGAIASSLSPSNSISPFIEATPNVSREELTRCVQDEWRRLYRRRKLLSPPLPTSSASREVQSMAYTSQSSSFWNSVHSPTMSQPQTSTFPNGSPSQLGTMVPQHGKEQPSLSIKQVVLLCERLWKEREEKLCEEYDQILNEKLGEQYDSFLKFTQDQIIRKYQQSSCSYVS